MSGELRFADQKSKSFKTYPFEFSQAKLCYYKDKRVSHFVFFIIDDRLLWSILNVPPLYWNFQGAVKLAEWPVEEIVWYEGYENKRNPTSRSVEDCLRILQIIVAMLIITININYFVLLGGLLLS